MTDITLLIESAMGLLVVLMILILFMVVKPQKESVTLNKTKKEPKQTHKQNTDLLYLKSIIKNRKSSTKELKDALELILKHHGTIHKKLGMRAHPDFDIYLDILITICRHPNTDKDVILDFDRGLQNRNPEYKPDINHAIAKGLNSRGL